MKCTALSQAEMSNCFPVYYSSLNSQLKDHPNRLILVIDLNSQLNILKKLLSLLTANAECHRRVINSSKCCHCHGRNSQGLCWRGCRGRYVSYLTFSYFNRLVTVRSSPVRFMKALTLSLENSCPVCETLSCSLYFLFNAVKY